MGGSPSGSFSPPKKPPFLWDLLAMFDSLGPRDPQARLLPDPSCEAWFRREDRRPGLQHADGGLEKQQKSWDQGTMGGFMGLSRKIEGHLRGDLSGRFRGDSMGDFMATGSLTEI